MSDLTSLWLTKDGDARIAVDPATGRNPYGCPPKPDPALLDFGSATASVISETAFAAADRLRHLLLPAGRTVPDMADLYRETARIGDELLHLCGLPAREGVRVFLTASGTDAHRLASEWAWAASDRPPCILAMEPNESGRGVPEALSAPCHGTLLPIRVRDDSGLLRPQAAVDDDVLAAARQAFSKHRPFFAVLTDVSKTGLVAPRRAVLRELERHVGQPVPVLVDASQFRLAPDSLKAYLDQGDLVALTGSKFVGGPSFSGALLVPRNFPAHLSIPPLSPLPLGQLLRWEAALAELRQFRALPENDVRDFFGKFASAVTAHIAHHPQLEALPSGAPSRDLPAENPEWDSLQTIFPFLLSHPGTKASDLLVPQEMQAVFRRLPEIRSSGAEGAIRGRLGQPVDCGLRHNKPISALRLCVSARHAVHAVNNGPRGVEQVVAEACAVLDEAARIAGRIREKP
ncbi:MAG: hypothetical protein KGJ15_00465 [Betaproteobacteria bacterium]|nr:hypothetical protein [Betaproteobacteria bacterium]MDE2211207.1 hypothetical protein [Betaproteobacteria bacterium]